MDRMADIRIVASTSLIEINSSNILSGSNAIVYLSTPTSQGSFITIRDIDGICSSTRPIIVSTTSGISFFEGGIQSSFTIVEPYQSYLLGSKNSNQWSVVNTFSFPLSQVLATVSTVSTGILNTSSPVTMLTNSFISSQAIKISTLSSIYTFSKKFTLNSYAVNCNTPQGKLDVDSFLPMKSTLVRKLDIGKTAFFTLNSYSTSAVLQSNTNQALMLASFGTETNASVQFNLASQPLYWSTAIFDQTVNIRAIGYDGYRFIGVGQGGGYNMSFSEDGITWSNSTTAPFSNCYNIKYNGQQWLLLGEGTTTSGILYSSDGVTWNSTVNSMKIAKDAIYDGKKWVAVGNPSTVQLTKTIQYSYDGITWNDITSGGFYTEGRGIDYNGSIYVATGKGTGLGIEESIQRSLDGINWSYTEGCLFDKTKGGNKVKFHYPYWVVVGYTDISGAGVMGSILHSINGTEWSYNPGTGGFDLYGSDIVWNGSYWVATGKDTSKLNCIQYASNVGINSEVLPPLAFYPATSIQGSGNTAFSILQTNPITPNLNTKEFHITTQNIDNNNLSTNELFVNDYFTYINKSLLSKKIPSSGSFTDGTVGISAGSTINVGIIDCNYAFSSYRTVRISTILTDDLEVENYGLGHLYPLDYTSIARISSFYPVRLDVSNTIQVNHPSTPYSFIAVGDSILKSSDGFTWSSINSSFSPPAITSNFTFITNNDSLMLMGGLYTGLYYTSNTSNWYKVASLSNARINTIAWNGSYWLAGGSFSNIFPNPYDNAFLAKSFDGITWSFLFSNTQIVPTALKWSSTIWVMGTSNLNPVGTNLYSSILLSYDNAVSWSTVTYNPPTGNFTRSCSAIEYNGNVWVAVGLDTWNQSYIRYAFNPTIWNGIQYPPFISSFTNIWYPVNPNPPNPISTTFGGGTDVRWNGTMFVATGYGNQFSSIRYSYDGVFWSTTSGGFSNNGNGLVWTGDKWIAVGQNHSSLTNLFSTIKYSYDGINWSTISSGFQTVGRKIAFFKNPTSDFTTQNLIVNTENKLFTPSTNVLLSYPSSLVLNNIITLEKYGNVGINTLYPKSVLDIDATSNNYPMMQMSDQLGTLPLSSFFISTLLSTVQENSATWHVSFTIPGFSPVVPSYLYSRYNSSNYYFSIFGFSFFTGQHAAVPTSTIDLLQNIGKIVSADKGYTSYTSKGKGKVTGKDAIWITEALPNIVLTEKDKDPKVFGVITNYTNQATYPDNENPFADKLGDRIRINGLGEGAIWITNINGSLENGDYICSSEIPGFGRKQDDDKLHSYTVAKITMSCDFELNQDNYICEEFEWKSSTLRKAFVGCTYHCS